MNSNVIEEDIIREEEKQPLNNSNKQINVLLTSDREIDRTINVSNETEEKSKFSKYDYIIIITVAFGNFCVACGVSIQGPFFPQEAESKGASPAIYGSIFGVYELVMLSTSFLFGKLVSKVAPNLMSGFGLLTTGLSTIAFGLLSRIPSGNAFIILAFATRIIESLGATAFATSSYSFITYKFSHITATIFSIMETSFGLGLIIGPAVGGVLYSLGDYSIPFSVLGSMIIISAFVIIVFLSKESAIERSGNRENDSNNNNNDRNITKFLKHPVIILDSIQIITALNLIGFNYATLEPHLRQFSLTPITIGLIFVSLGAMYAITVPIWGKLCDTVFKNHLIIVSMIGSLLSMIGLALIGPLPFIRLDSNLWLINLSLLLFGIGSASKQVSSFSHALNYSIRVRGYEKNSSIHALVSAMFFACISLGGFLGPIIGGVLLEKFSYRIASLFMFSTEVLLFIVLVFVLLFKKNIN